MDSRQDPYPLPMLLELVAVGENSGSLGEMLGHVADLYDTEMDTRLTSLAAALGISVVPLVASRAEGVPELIAEANKHGLDVELVHGDDLEALAKEVLSQPAEVIASMKRVMGE